MAIPRGIVPPNLPVALKEYDQRGMEQFNNVLRLYFNQMSNKLNSPTPHASYYDTTTQTNPVIDTVNLFTFNSIVSEFQVTRGTPTSKIFVNNTGVYNFQFSAQLDKSGGAASDIFIWARINGKNVPDSAGEVTIDGPNDEVITSWNYVLVLEAGDYFELAWQSSDANIIVPYVPPTGNIPGIPSIILTVTWVSNDEANR